MDDGFENYEKYFSHCPENRFRVEATPDYLYSPSTAQRIIDSLPDVKLLFILRHPVERLVSWYRFSKQQGLLQMDISFGQYVSNQFKIIDQGADYSKQQHMRTLEQGRYSNYLKYYIDTFREDQVLILDYADLKSDTKSMLKRVAFIWRIIIKFL